jgi:hypothetical protein
MADFVGHRTTKAWTHWNGVVVVPPFELTE